MVLINGRKFACEACVRGHRASSCSHTGRQLQQVRPKGRPSSQCDMCKSKRVNGSFHGKCQCNAVIGETSRRGSSGGGTSSPEDARLSMIEDTDVGRSAGENIKGRHSLESLMNPCRCKTTGICTCCKSDTGKENGGSGPSDVNNGEGCCDMEQCCTDSVAEVACQKSTQKGETSKSCCAGGGAKQDQAQEERKDDSIFAPQPELTGLAEGSDQLPPCHCGPNCSCPGCIKESEESRQMRARNGENEECPDKCITCSACVFGLTRPSGIEAIDQWMERDKDASKQEVEKETSDREAPKKRAKRATAMSQYKSAPPLPPFPDAAKFYSSHFLDPERRKYFADRLRGADQVEEFTPPHEPESELNQYGKRLLGESDEDWQIRHGFYHLTPEAIRIFDSARIFKEQRQRQEEEEERLQLEESVTPSESSVSSSLPAALSTELNDLRRKALLARKRVAV